MTLRRRTAEHAGLDRDSVAPADPRSATDVGIQPRAPRAEVAPAARSAEDAEARYVAARDVWTAAMRAANSGRAADLATLAVAQEAYEAAAAELEDWRRRQRVAIPVEPARPLRAVDAIVGQELAWRRVREHEKRVHEKASAPGVLGRLARRLRGG